MIKRECTLTEGEKSEILHCGIIPRKGHWHTKDEVIKKLFNWKPDFFNNICTIHMIEWDAADKRPWEMSDDVYRSDYVFNVYTDLDQLVGFMFQASIDGYTIRYVYLNCYDRLSLYLERSKDASTNIDEDVLNILLRKVGAFDRSCWCNSFGRK